MNNDSADILATILTPLVIFLICFGAKYFAITTGIYIP